MEPAVMSPTVVCLGDSITLGQISASYIEILQHRMNAKGFQFVNAGINNDLSYNVWKRLDAVISLQPDFVILLIGTNDILGSINPGNGFLLRLRKGLPRNPDMHWYTENLLAIVHQLKMETHAKLALASIPLLGENLKSNSNRRVMAYNAVIKEIARQEQAAYLPVFESQVAYLKASGITRGRTFHWELSVTAELVITRAIFHESYESFSRRQGFKLLTDGVHMNPKGAEIIANPIEDFLLASN
jgi:lysophospholipase L1-like esterase